MQKLRLETTFSLCKRGTSVVTSSARKAFSKSAFLPLQVLQDRLHDEVIGQVVLNTRAITDRSPESYRNA